IHRSVDMPVKGTFEIVRLIVDLRIERHLVDHIATHLRRELAERLRERNLLFIREVDLREDQYASLLQELTNCGRMCTAQQRWLIPADFSSYPWHHVFGGKHLKSP